MNKKRISAIQIDSLETLQMRKNELDTELQESEDKLSDIWNKMFHQPTEEEMASPTQRAMSLISSSMGLIDGAILGWKLYKKFGKGLSLFKKKKK